jgi:hypothetical protein
MRVRSEQTKERDRKRSRERYASDPAFRAANNQHSTAWYNKNREKVLATLKQAYRADRTKYIEKSGYQRRKLRDYLVEAQGGRCAACGSLKSRHKWGWQIHHLHQPKTDYVVLCAKCNRGSSLFADDPALLRKMADINEALATIV